MKLPEDNHGRQMVDLVRQRVQGIDSSSRETRRFEDTWTSIRREENKEKVLKQVLAMHRQNGQTALDPIMLQWSRMAELEDMKFEEKTRPLKNALTKMLDSKKEEHA